MITLLKKNPTPDFITALSLFVCADLPGTNLSLSLSLVSFFLITQKPRENQLKLPNFAYGGNFNGFFHSLCH